MQNFIKMKYLYLYYKQKHGEYKQDIHQNEVNSTTIQTKQINYSIFGSVLSISKLQNNLKTKNESTIQKNVVHYQNQLQIMYFHYKP